MDIAYLLALQDLRHALGSVVELIMVAISYIGDGPILVALTLIIYWCISKQLGHITIASLAASSFFCYLLKNIVCIYRPWIIDERIVPAQGALDGADGYSFPSGHSSGSTAFFGSIAWYVRKKHKGLAIACLLLIALIVFSRNFLGVHTPQDVLAGIAISALFVVGAKLFCNWLERCDAMIPGHKRDLAVLIIVLIVCAASIAFISLKAYPMDYVNGQLLVDPVEMQKGSFETTGMLAGVAIGWYLERHFVNFATGPELSVRQRVARGVVGVGLVGITYLATDIVFKALLPYLWAKLFAYATLCIVALFVVPLLFSALDRRFE